MNFKKIIHKIISKIIYIFLIILNKITLKTLDNLLKIYNIYIIFLREDRIGHQAGNADVEFFKANLRKKRNNSKTIFIFPFPKNKIANKYVRFKLINFVNLNFYKAIVLKYNFINILFSNLLIYSLPIIFDSCKNIYYSKTDVGKRLSKNIFQNNNKNISIFNDLGIKKENYICIYARDNNYLNKLDPKTNWSYHEYRNSNIDNLRLLSEYIIEKQNWHVVRVGSSPQNRISWFKDEDNKIIDYPFSEYRSEKNDIDLISNCKLYISNGGGPESVAIAARREIIKINQVPLGDQHGNNFGLWLPKLHLKNKTKKYLSLIEICELRLGSKFHGSNFKQLDLSLIENSPSDIMNIFYDYIKFKNNNFSEEEQYFINQYHKVRKIIFSNWGILNSKKNFIAPSFLKKYNNLLDH